MLQSLPSHFARSFTTAVLRFAVQIHQENQPMSPAFSDIKSWLGASSASKPPPPKARGHTPPIANTASDAAPSPDRSTPPPYRAQSSRGGPPRGWGIPWVGLCPFWQGWPWVCRGIVLLEKKRKSSRIRENVKITNEQDTYNMINMINKWWNDDICWKKKKSCKAWQSRIFCDFTGECCITYITAVEWNICASIRDSLSQSLVVIRIHSVKI